MIRRLLYGFAARLPCRLIYRDERHPYLERYFLFQVGHITVYLHRFVAADADKEVHDHPWRALAVCLAGSYREERVVLDSGNGWQSTHRRIFPGRLNLLGLRDFHRIAQTKPETWTLFIHGRRRKEWGFLDTWLNEKGERITVYRPPSRKTAVDWWRNAPIGNKAGREPYGGRPSTTLP